MLAREPEILPHDPTVRWVTSRQLDDDIKVLAGKLPWPCRVAGIPRSGMTVASRLSTHMNVRLQVADDHIKYLSSGRRMRVSRELYDVPLVLVDDSIHTGAEMLRARKRFPYAAFATVYCHPSQLHLVDHYVHAWPMPHLFEWHFFGSDLVEQAAFDMDGLICEDCPVECDDDGEKYAAFLANAKPLWVPRPHRVPLIVTARLRKYEPQTRAWLDRYGVKVDRIIFHPARTLEERDRTFNPGMHKGLPFRQANVKYFFESCPKQAALVAYWAHKPVICPVTGDVFQGR